MFSQCVEPDIQNKNCNTGTTEPPWNSQQTKLLELVRGCLKYANSSFTAMEHNITKLAA